MELTALQVFVAGSYPSAFAIAGAPLGYPPVTSTLPSDSSVAVYLERCETMELVVLHVAVTGSYTSPVQMTLPPYIPPTPPVMSTLPSDSGVAVCSLRGSLRESVGLHVSVMGSYPSAVRRLVPKVPPYPPATSTLPPGSGVAV